MRRGKTEDDIRNDIEVGKRLQYYRQKAGISRQELANRTYQTAQTIYNYEAGSRHLDAEKAAPLAKELNISVADILETSIVASTRFYTVRSCEPEAVIHFLNFAGIKVELLFSVSAADLADTAPMSFSGNFEQTSPDSGQHWHCVCSNGQTVPATLETVKLSGKGVLRYDPRKLSDIPASDRAVYLDSVDFGMFVRDIQDFIQLSVMRLKKEPSPAVPDNSDRQFIVSNSDNLTLDPDGRKRLTHPDLLHIAPENF